MKSLPDELPGDGDEAFTGLICPGCAGNIVVHVQQRHVTFRCRVGHAYSVVELLTAKETVLEERMWSAVFAYEELTSMLTELAEIGLLGGLDLDACGQRAGAARGNAARLRAVLQEDRSLVLSDGRDPS